MLSAALGALWLPGLAQAATFSWSMPGDFTTVGGGSNPDHDRYGASPWSYDEGPAVASSLGSPSLRPPSTSHLQGFSTSLPGGRTGWTDPGDSNVFVADDAGELLFNPAADRVAVLTWTSPLPRTATVSIGGFVANHGACSAWSLNQGTTVLQSRGIGNAISQTASVDPGATIQFVVGYSEPRLVYAGDPTCAGADVFLQITANQNAAPSPTLTSPGNGAVITGQPLFSGQAGSGFDADDHVTVEIYSGNAAGGTPIQTVRTIAASDGSYTVGLTMPLPDGEYTAQVEQSDRASPPEVGKSVLATFVVQSAAPTLTLGSPGSRPLHTATPTFSGKATSRTGASRAVALIIYPGAGTGGSAARFIEGTRTANGSFRIQVAPALADGRYTALAAQQGAGGKLETSQGQTFRVKIHPPALALIEPAADASLTGSNPTFSGHAGDALGDSATVRLTLWSGRSTRRRPLGSLTTAHFGRGWSLRWPGALRPGRYTVQASQRDDAGHLTITRARTFRLLSAPTPIGSRVTISRTGLVSLQVSCLAPSGQTCTGTVLVLTARRYQPVPSGPGGRLRVLYAYVQVVGGHNLTVSQQLPGAIAALLRRNAPLPVQVSTALSAGGQSTGYTGVRTLVAVR